MKVLLITAAFPPMRAGEADHALNLSRQLGRKGLDVHVLMTKGHEEPVNEPFTAYPGDVRLVMVGPGSLEHLREALVPGRRAFDLYRMDLQRASHDDVRADHLPGLAPTRAIRDPLRVSAWLDSGQVVDAHPGTSQSRSTMGRLKRCRLRVRISAARQRCRDRVEQPSPRQTKTYLKIEK